MAAGAGGDDTGRRSVHNDPLSVRAAARTGARSPHVLVLYCLSAFSPRESVFLPCCAANVYPHSTPVRQRRRPPLNVYAPRARHAPASRRQPRTRLCPVNSDGRTGVRRACKVRAHVHQNPDVSLTRPQRSHQRSGESAMMPFVNKHPRHVPGGPRPAQHRQHSPSLARFSRRTSSIEPPRSPTQRCPLMITRCYRIRTKHARLSGR